MDSSEFSSLSVCEAIAGRRSVRRYLATPVPETTIEAILSVASRAASGMNMQPWLVHIVTGDSRDRLIRRTKEKARAGETSLEYNYLPDKFKEPYRSRRLKVGYDLYALSGIEKNDKHARREAMMQNYEFFGAPVGLFLTIDRHMSLGSWLDAGMFLQNVMLLARAAGLETCPQQAWCDYGGVVREQLGIPNEHILLTGMAIGYIDPSAPVNTLQTERASPDKFATWHA